MRTDRELLELAAKAAGIQVLKWSTNHAGGEIGRGLARNEEWNPLNDDGDALRLVTHLLLSVTLNSFGAGVGGVFPDGRQVFRREKSGAGGLPAATRRAIVLAAAEIGAAM